MSDKELLELAAKAAEMKLTNWRWYDGMPPKFVLLHEGEPTSNWWNPLTDDGDALRLAVKLGLAIRVLEKCVFVESDPETLLGQSSVTELEMFGNPPDKFLATRRAIVRAAAEIGRVMP